jgi:N-acetylglucosamine-6-sulfatase
MPKVKTHIVDPGVRFSQAFVVNPECCPSRASFLTGKYSHGTNIYRNRGPFGGFGSFDDSSTLATWLDEVGYRTALVGKYMNGYRDGSYLPPGWDKWTAFTSQRGNGNYYNYSLTRNGAISTYGSAVTDYSTDVLAADASAFIRATPDTTPLFLLFTPNAPHAPATPAERHRASFAELDKWNPPSYNEADVSDKPAYIQSSSPIGTQEFRRNQYRTLLAVDDAVERIVGTLRDTGRLQNTMLVFASDNGFLWSEHRWKGKAVPYEESIRIPFAIRYDPGVTAPHTNGKLVNNLDFAPTVAKLAGAASPGGGGRDLMPLVNGQAPKWRTDFLIEHMEDLPETPVPTYCAVRDVRYTFVAYATGEKELYDNTRDPYQLDNRAGDPAYTAVQDRLLQRLRFLCKPPPPGYTLP